MKVISLWMCQKQQLGNSIHFQGLSINKDSLAWVFRFFRFNNVMMHFTYTWRIGSGARTRRTRSFRTAAELSGRVESVKPRPWWCGCGGRSQSAGLCWLLSCHRPGCGFTARGTVSRKSTHKSILLLAKQRKSLSRRFGTKNNSSYSS